MIKPHPARPKYCLGQQVRYLDHTKRPQIGVIKMIKATWGQFRSDSEHAYISVEISHPTYQNRTMYLREADVLGLAEEAPHDR